MSSEDGGIFVGPGDGKALPNPIGGRMVVKVRDEDTGGATRSTTTRSRQALRDRGPTSTAIMTRPSTSWRGS
jgi:hypothetical protein